MTGPDTAPGAPQFSAPAVDALPPAPPEPTEPTLPPAPPKPDTKPKRPTTRAGRRAASAARAASGKDDKAPKASKPTPRKAALDTRLTATLVSLGTMVAAAGSITSPAVQLDGVAIITHAPDIAAALDKVAKNDPRVSAALESMLTAGVWSGLVAAMLPLVLTIAANHGALPANVAAMVGIETPGEQQSGPVGVV